MLDARTSIRPFSKLQILFGAVGLAMALLPVASDLSTTLAESVGTDRAPTEAQVFERLGNADLTFIENRGQLDQRVRYYIQGADASLFFTDRGVRMSLTAEGTHEPAADAGDTRWVIDHAFLNAAPVTPVASLRAETTVSYFKGEKDDWQAGLPTFERISYPNVWPGIDLVYRGTAAGLKYELMVQPGANPNAIALAYRHAGALSATATGDLEITTPVGTVTDTAPIAYQARGSTRTPVPVSFAPTGKRYGFEVGRYNRNRALVIDPTVLVYSGFIGGDGDESGTGIAVDPTGAAYITGSTSSSQETFPTVGGPDLSRNDANSDAFVAKVAPGGDSLVYAGYIGGSNFDTGNGIAVDSAGAAYITGETASNETSFPVTIGPDVTFNGGFSDAFVAKVGSSGASLTYAGYIGGDGIQDIGKGIAVDSAGAAYVAGTTESAEGTFPETGGPDVTFNGFNDAFVAKVAPGGGALEYAGFIGGDCFDRGNGIAVDSAGAAYVTGMTCSTEQTFPVAGGPDLVHNGDPGAGDIDAFVVKVAPGGGSLVYGGFIGGHDTDFGNGIAVDSAGAAYVTGETRSPPISFPEAGGPDLDHNGGLDAFVAKVGPDGSSLAYAGYIGGAAFDLATGIAVDSAGAAYVTGITSSTEASFPVIDGPDLTFNGGGEDGFVTKVAPDGLMLDYSGYIGGTSPEEPYGIAVDRSGAAYVTGLTGFPEAGPQENDFPTIVGPDLDPNGGSDAFVTKVSDPPPAEPTIHQLSLTKEGSGLGTVTSAPEGIDCGSDCEHTYPAMSSVTLSAEAAPGSAFTGWSGACTGTGACTVQMTDNKRVSATFQPVHALTVVRTGRGTGTVTSTPIGIDCGASCTQTFEQGTDVALTPAPGSGSRFVEWTGCDEVSANQCLVTMSTDKSVSVTFGLIRRERSISLRLRRHLIAKGRVTSRDDIDSCMVGIPVRIDRRVGGEWKEITVVTSRGDGSFRTRIEDTPGRYRAVVTGLVTGDGLCRRASSAGKRHEH